MKAQTVIQNSHLPPGAGETPARPVSETGRRRLRISVRGLMVLVLVSAGGLGWTVSRAQIQREAVAAIRRAGGWVVYEGPTILSLAQPGWRSGPQWLGDRIGPHYFLHVAAVDLGPQGSDAVIAQVGKLSRLRQLFLDGSHVTSAGMVHLKGLTSLQELNLDSTSVDDTGLGPLKGLTGLQVLSLRRTCVTDVGFRDLQKALRNLKICR
jgi:hypothetical protein